MVAYIYKPFTTNKLSIMRFLLTLTCQPPQQLPLNYQYPLSAWIYKTFNEGDPAFAEWLHTQGYTNGKHHYKMFTFSWLDIPKVKLDKQQQCLVINSHEVYLTFSLPMEDAAETFIKGLFQDRECWLGDRNVRADFQVSSVEKLPEPELGTEASFRCLSPICLSAPKEKNDKLYAQYLSPEDDGYTDQLFNNLIHRYQTACQYQEEERPPRFWKPWRPEAADEEAEAPFDFQLLNKPKSKLVTVKAGTNYETKVRGYQFDFKLKAPAELLRFGYEAGFGEKGSLGFGCVEKE